MRSTRAANPQIDVGLVGDVGRYDDAARIQIETRPAIRADELLPPDLQMLAHATRGIRLRKPTTPPCNSN